MRRASELAQQLVDRFSGMTFSDGTGEAWLKSEIAKALLTARDETLDEAAELTTIHNGCINKECFGRNCAVVLFDQIMALKKASDKCWTCKHYKAWHHDKGHCMYRSDGKFCSCLEYKQESDDLRMSEL